MVQCLVIEGIVSPSQTFSPPSLVSALCYISERVFQSAWILKNNMRNPKRAFHVSKTPDKKTVIHIMIFKKII